MFHLAILEIYMLELEIPHSLWHSGLGKLAVYTTAR